MANVSGITGIRKPVENPIETEIQETVTSEEVMNELMREFYGGTWNAGGNTLEENIEIVKNLTADNAVQIEEMAQNGAEKETVEQANTLNYNGFSSANKASHQNDFSEKVDESTVDEVKNAVKSQSALNAVLHKANSLFKTVGVSIYATLNTPFYVIEHMNYSSNIKDCEKRYYKQEAELAALTAKYNYRAAMRTRKENMRRIRKGLPTIDANSITYTPKERERIETQKMKLEKISGRLTSWKERKETLESKRNNIITKIVKNAKELIARSQPVEDIFSNEIDSIQKQAAEFLGESSKASNIQMPLNQAKETKGSTVETDNRDDKKAPSNKKDGTAAKLKMQTVVVDPLKIGRIFGTAGSTLKAIKESTGVYAIQVKGDKVTVKGHSQEQLDSATKLIKQISNGPTVGDKFNATVTGINTEKNYAIVTLAPGIKTNLFVSAFTKDRDARIEDFVSKGAKLNATYLGEKEGKNGRSYAQYAFEKEQEKAIEEAKIQEDDRTEREEQEKEENKDWRGNHNCTNILNSLGVIYGSEMYRALETMCLKHKDQGWLAFDALQLSSVVKLMMANMYSNEIPVEQVIDTAIKKGFDGKQMDVVFSACLEYPGVDMVNAFNPNVSAAHMFQCIVPIANILEQGLAVDTLTLQELTVQQTNTIELLVRKESSYNYSDEQINEIIDFFKKHPSVCDLKDYIVMTAHEEAMQERIAQSNIEAVAEEVSGELTPQDEGYVPFPDVTTSELTVMAEDNYNETGSLLEQFIEWQDKAEPVLEYNGLSMEEATCVVNGQTLSKMFIFDTKTMEYTGEHSANPFKDTIIKGVELFPEAIDELDQDMKRDLEFMAACYEVNPDCQMYMDADIAEKVINAPSYNCKSVGSDEIAFNLKTPRSKAPKLKADDLMYAGEGIKVAKAIGRDIR